MGSDTTGDLGAILGVWGHPDDEAYLSAGLMATAVAAGRRLLCVTATRGEAGFPADDPRTLDERKAVREAELADCLTTLGVTDHRYLGYPDGGCADVPDEQAVAAVAEIIAQERPDTVLTFGPDGGTGHRDHIAACRWTTRAYDLAAPPGSRLLYATKTEQWIEQMSAGADRASFMMMEGLQPEAVDADELAVWFTCDDSLLARKVAALRAQVSQVEPLVQAVGLENYYQVVRDEFFRERRPSDAAEIDRYRRL